MANSPTNAFCVDVDDLAGSNFELGKSLREWRYTFEAETDLLLGELDALNINGTFFVPGLVTENAPALVGRIHQLGHQIASHGTRHCLVEAFEPQTYLDDVVRSKKTLEDMTGCEVDTYKAPVWSITPRCAWAYDVLMEAGFRVDNSAMPATWRHLGGRPDSLEPICIADQMWVIPVTSVRIFGFNVPMPGGFYNAYLPFQLQRRIFDGINGRDQPFNFYFHPYEHSPSHDSRRFLQHRSVFMTLYSLHVGRYLRLLREMSSHYRLSTLRNAYARWLD
jgi:polysaccharide deacetylase family protein (PEP-CTERM system associated)